jgi:iron complex outermembrane recepter protein
MRQRVRAIARFYSKTFAAGILGLVTLSGVSHAQNAPFTLPTIDVISTGPGDVGAIPRDKVPAFTTTVTSQEFERINSPSITDTLQFYVPGGVAIDINGNDFQQEFFYRGFVASPVQGTPQGLAVYQNGVRVNEAFGDTVNFDLIPPQAIYRADVFTNNPLFGLNALGGAINLQMKNGFLWQGLEAQFMGGSYGRMSSMFQYGMQKDNYSLYVTADETHDAGWRFFSPSNLARLYSDLGYRTPDAEIHIIATGATSNLGIVGVTPIQLLDMDWRSVFTSPQSSLNEMGSIAINAKVNISPTWSVTALGYYRHFFQYHQDGNDANIADCGTVGGTPGQLCDTDNGSPLVTQNGQIIASNGLTNFPYGVVDYTFVHTNTIGGSVQATNKDSIFGHENQITFGSSLDQSWINYNANTTLGCINGGFVVVNCNIPGSGQIIQDQNNQDFVQTYLSGTTTYVGVYALDTFNITPELALTAGARFNLAIIATQDQSGLDPELNATNTYQRINPVVGLAYKVTPHLTAYAGYSEANRAPTPLETDCSSSLRPCILASSLISDPPLQQVVSHTIEAGLRGNGITPGEGQIEWKAGFFRTESDNDIIQLSSLVLGTGFFTNVPETLRQGVEASVKYRIGVLDLYANYAYVNATFQFNGLISSPQNPFADANGNIVVKPGDNIPGIPRNQAKFGADYWFTSKLKVGGDVAIVGSQYFVGDQSNQNPQLPLYWFANLHAYYQVADHVQVFGMINNVFNNHYAPYGTFFDLGTDSQFATSRFFTSNPQAITPAQPLAVYAGVKITF